MIHVGAPQMALGAGREFDLIRTMLARWGPRARGIGDDAATLDLPRGDQLVASVDAMVEGRHFHPGWLTPREVGYRAVAAALSDLAAMASTPLGIMLALGISDEWMHAVPEIADGVGDALDVAGTVIVGGNVTGASELALVTTVLGSAFGVLTRDGVRPGHHVYVTGQLGGSGAALRELLAGGVPSPQHHLRFAHPTPRLREARWLADHGATSCIDISDGLAADLGHLAAASGVTLEVDVDSIPCVSGVAPEDALASGEEYELVVSTRADLDVARFAERFGLPLTRIGRAVAGASGVRLMRDGVRVANPPGYDHLSR